MEVRAEVEEVVMKQIQGNQRRTGSIGMAPLVRVSRILEDNVY